MWPQAEALTLVDILIQKPCCDATCFTKFAERVGFPIPMTMPVGGFTGQWEAEDIAQFLWPDPRRAMWPQAEALTLVDILIQKPCCDATRFTKFAERVGFPIPMTMPVWGVYGPMGSGGYRTVSLA